MQVSLIKFDVASQLHEPWFNLELGLLSVWGSTCSPSVFPPSEYIPISGLATGMSVTTTKQLIKMN